RRLYFLFIPRNFSLQHIPSVKIRTKNANFRVSGTRPTQTDIDTRLAVAREYTTHHWFLFNGIQLKGDPIPLHIEGVNRRRKPLGAIVPHPAPSPRRILAPA